MSGLNVFKVEYYWYEGEHEETFLAKGVNEEDFEKDLLEAKDFAEKLKGIKKEKLRDNMNDLELIFSMLGERATTEIARTKDSIGLEKNKDAAIKGGNIAGDARKKLEIETKRKVTSSENYLDMPEKEKRKQISKKRDDNKNDRT